MDKVLKKNNTIWEWFILEISESAESIGNESDGTDDTEDSDISKDSDMSRDFDVSEVWFD